MPMQSTTADTTPARDATVLAAKAAAYDRINTPELFDFVDAVRNEALHQRERWGIENDGGKTDADWFWLIGYLAGKALHNPDKPDMPPAEARLHRIITVAAAAANWHAATRRSAPTRPCGPESKPHRRSAMDEIIEQVSDQVHANWMSSKRAAGVVSRKLESGEELMVPYAELSEQAKELDRGTVRTVLAVLPAVGYRVVPV